MNKNFLHIYNKELKSFFSSSIAYIFIFCFLAVSLFSFFWVEGFFARNIADIKPLFEWLPILLIFLVSALTMKMWSEEKRTGTIEVLFSNPQKRLTYVLGKFFASLTLVMICLFMTIGIPITVHFMGALDMGPVIGAYVASIFLASFYISVGLYISAKTDNQIVSLIMSILILSIFYLIGSNFFTAFFSNNIADIFRLIGSGSRFESITKGVLDIRDVYYYISLSIIFLSLNLYTLKNLSWDKNKSHLQSNKMIFLIISNVLVLNFCITFINCLRIDLTKDNRYSISSATKNIISNLEEPLLIRGYFSKRTHPLLSPLIPQLKDLIKEYKIVGDGKIDIEFIDPKDSPEAEKLANSKYGIKPIPFQVGDKYEASLVNSYFDILIEYGDKYEVLNFQDLIEVKVNDETHIDVLLKNPEYDITRSIKKVLYEFKDISTLLSELNGNINFKAYISHDALLPKALSVLKGDLRDILNELKNQSNGKFNFEFITPDKKIAKEIYDKYGFQPMVGSLLSTQAFYFYMVLNNGKEEYAVTLPTDFQKESLRKSIENTLKRFSKGFIKTVGISSPRPEMNMQSFQKTGKSFQLLIQKLQETYKTKVLDLSVGMVPEDIDILIVNAPKNLDEKSIYAIDQFLMRGGSIIFNSGSHFVTRTYENIKAQKDLSGLEDWFKSKGITFGQEMVLDENNENYPIPVKRDLGGLVVQELKMIQYPMFVDVRNNSMNLDAGITAGITQLTLNWPNEILVDKEKNKERTVTPLLNSSKKSWTLNTEEIEPNFILFPKWGFRQTEKKGPFALAYIIEGGFESFFNGKENPFSKKENTENNESKDENKEKEMANGDVVSFISHSPNSSKIIIFASNEFVEDGTLRISASTGGSRFMNSLQIIENTVDWSLEDKTLLSIRGKTNFSETLTTMSKDQKEFYEVLNYSIAMLFLIFSYFIYKIKKASNLNHYKKLFS